MTVHEDPVDQTMYASELEAENKVLHHKLEILEHELQCRSPTKSPRKARTPSLNLRNDENVLGSAVTKLNGMTLAPDREATSPGKPATNKIRKLTARRWDLMDENEMDAFNSH